MIYPLTESSGRLAVKDQQLSRGPRPPDLDGCKSVVLNSLDSQHRSVSTSMPSISSSHGTAPSWPSTASWSCAICIYLESQLCLEENPAPSTKFGVSS